MQIQSTKLGARNGVALAAASRRNSEITLKSFSKNFSPPGPSPSSRPATFGEKKSNQILEQRRRRAAVNQQQPLSHFTENKRSSSTAAAAADFRPGRLYQQGLPLENTLSRRKKGEVGGGGGGV